MFIIADDSGSDVTDQVNSKVNTETEIVIYSEISNINGLELADSKEKHFQLETNFINGDKCRVRRTIKEEDINYTFTIKIKNKDSNISKCEELEKEVDELFFKTFFKTSDNIVQKIRYTFNRSISIIINGEKIIIPDINYEVDVFFKKDYGVRGCLVSDWCKIDIEIDKVISYLEENRPGDEDIEISLNISDLPFKPKNSILASNCTDKEKEKIKELWKNNFSTIREEYMKL